MSGRLRDPQLAESLAGWATGRCSSRSCNLDRCTLRTHGCHGGGTGRISRVSSAQAHERTHLGPQATAGVTSCTAGLSRRAMKQVRARVRALTPQGRCHTDLRLVIADVNRVLRGWGAVFPDGECGEPRRTARRLRGGAAARLVFKHAGSRLSAGRARAWRRPLFEALGLVRLRGTIRYPGVVHAAT